MQKLLCLIILTANFAFAQSNFTNENFERKGFSFGLGVGAGILTLNSSANKLSKYSYSMPNMKIGYALNDQFSIMLTLPGASYKSEGKDRGFEGVVLSAQYWIKSELWINGGFYTVKDISSAEFYTGIPSVAIGTGYEIFKKGKFSIDLQYRLFLGKSNLLNGLTRTGISNMILIGFNWY